MFDANLRILKEPLCLCGRDFKPVCAKGRELSNECLAKCEFGQDYEVKHHCKCSSVSNGACPEGDALLNDFFGFGRFPGFGMDFEVCKKFPSYSNSNMVFRKHKKVNPVITAVSIKPMIQNAVCTWVHINDSNMNAK